MKTSVASPIRRACAVCVLFVLSGLPVLATAPPVITAPGDGAVIHHPFVDIQVSVAGIPDVQSVTIHANGTLIGNAIPTSLFGEWTFPDTSHLSVLQGDEPGEAMIDYTPPEWAPMFLMGGRFNDEDSFSGTFDHWANNQTFAGDVTVDFSFTPAGLLVASIAGDSPLGSRTLTGGLSLNETYHYAWNGPPAGSVALTAVVSYLPSGSSTPATLTSAPLTLTVQPPAAPEIAVEQPAGKPLADNQSIRGFGKVAVGTAGKDLGFVVRNTGNAGLTGIAVTVDGANSGDFKVVKPPPVTLAAGAWATMVVRFKPAAAGARAAVLHIASNDSDESPFDIRLAGTGVSLPEITVEQPKGSGLVDAKSKRGFGTVKVGKAGVAKTFTIRNTGRASLTNLAVGKNGAHAADFIVTRPGRTTLAPGGSTTFRVTFKPKARGTRNAALHIRSNDADENPFDIRITGSGS